ncbi:MAG: retroviral-like aspartic protease family protein [Bacteroidaceae bacterium]|nr:retroviral-like aspartic protease family protein [Bacteroidaceae bacterium]
MLRLKLNAPYEQVYVYISLENPLTGQKRTIDAKIDTGAAVTVIPKSVIEGLELPSLGNCSFTMVDGTPLEMEAQMCRLSFSDEDTIDTLIYVCNSESGVALLGMDVLRLCNFAQWHEWSCDEHSVYFEMELTSEDVM